MPVVLWNHLLGQWVVVTGGGTDPEPEPSGWPDATNTGIAGVGLTVGELTSGGSMTATSGQTIQNRRISGTITVTVPNVTIRRCWIDAADFGVDAFGGSTNLLIEDCTVVGGGNCGLAVGSNATVRRCNIYGGEDGMKADDGLLLEDCFIHDLESSDVDPHHDGIQFGAVSNVTIRHNWIVNPDTSNIAMFAGQVAPGSNILIEDNYFSGPGYNIYLPGEDATNVRVLNNVFGTWFYGPVSDWYAGGGNVWSGNTRASDGSPVNP